PFSSLDAQRDAAESFVRSQAGRGWVALPDHYDDGGFTGANTKRPALTKLLADIEAGKVDVLLCYKLDRLTRSLADFMTISSLLDSHGVTLASVTEPISTDSPLGRAFVSVMMSFEQAEREVTAERTRDRAHAARRRGRFTGGTLVLGYDRHPDGGRLV